MKLKFITDYGVTYLVNVNFDGEKIPLARYGVWGDKGKGKPEVIETSDDLEHLLKVYGPGLPVFDTRITNE